MKKHRKVFWDLCLFKGFFFSNTIFTRRFSILSPSICVPFFFNWIWIQFKFHYNVVHASISDKNESMFLVSKTFGIFPWFVSIIVFLDDFNLWTNKENLLHVSLLDFGQNSYILRLFQHVISLTYKHVLSNYASYWYIEIVQEIVRKKTNVNAEGDNGKCFFI